MEPVKTVKRMIGKGLSSVATLAGLIGKKNTDGRRQFAAGPIAQTIAAFKAHRRDAKAEIKGEARSKAVRILPLLEINSNLIVRRKGPRVAEPTSVVLRMKDGTPMVYYDDGSLRHILGSKPSSKLKRRARARQLGKPLGTSSPPGPLGPTGHTGVAA